MNTRSILYVDDEVDNLTVFKSTFRREYNIHLAESGAEGMEILKNNDIQLIITDQRMPNMTGIQFLESVIPNHPDCIRMILTGFSDMEAIIEAINKGRVYRYITKPWNKEELRQTINNAIETFELKQKNKNLVGELQKSNELLEQKVIERTQKIEAQKNEITDSIRYAKRIQNALFPPCEMISDSLNDFFILNKPRDIVSGDFYWMAEKEDKVVVAVADCTGHGVPGAFMSMLGIAFLNEIVNKTVTLRANEILNQLRGNVIRSLHQTGKDNEARDGIEISLCIIDFKQGKIQYSGAFNPLYIIRNKEIIELKGDKMPIGIYNDEEESFTNQKLKLQKGDTLYMFSDGYVDQIGGPRRKTFRSKYFKELLLANSEKKMADQYKILEQTIDEWQGEIEQIDDILVMGIKVQ
jgi:serine phosphatase RsbU (regulator of sigma subunit)